MNAEVCFTPELLPAHDLSRTTVVVADIFRATTCMVTALWNGAEEIVPVTDPDICMMLKEKGYLSAGERGGEKLPGFDFGNSPFEFSAQQIAGKKIAVTTTNGTRALKGSESARLLIAGAFINIDAVARKVVEAGNDLLVVCAGWKGSFSMEDTLFAGALLHKVTELHKINQDAALAAWHLYAIAADNPEAFLKQASHFKRLEGLGVEKDMLYCLTPNLTDVVPVYKSGKLKADAGIVQNVQVSDND